MAALSAVGAARALLHRDASSICPITCSRGGRPDSTILRYLWYASPQFLYYLVPLAVLMGALVTIGALTKNTELVVMKACGISLYRAAAPLLDSRDDRQRDPDRPRGRACSRYSNRRADAINNAIRGRLPTTQS